MPPPAVLLLALLQLQIPAPRGYVNDFAGVLDPDAAARMTSLITELHQRTGADVAVVTLPDLGGRSAADVALQIGREWKLGGAGEAGLPAQNQAAPNLPAPPQNDPPRPRGPVPATRPRRPGFLPHTPLRRMR